MKNKFEKFFYKVTYIEGEGYELGLAENITGGYDFLYEKIASIEDVLLFIRNLGQYINEHTFYSQEKLLDYIVFMWNFIAENPTAKGGDEHPEQLMFVFGYSGTPHFIKEIYLKEQHQRILDGKEAKSEEIQGDASVKQQIRQRLATIRSGAKAVTKEMVAILHVHDKQEGGA